MFSVEGRWKELEAGRRRTAAAQVQRWKTNGRAFIGAATASQKGISGCNFGSLANSVRESHGFASRSHDRFAFIDLLAAARRRLTAAKDIYVAKRHRSN